MYLYVIQFKYIIHVQYMTLFEIDFEKSVLSGHCHNYNVDKVEKSKRGKMTLKGRTSLVTRITKSSFHSNFDYVSQQSQNDSVSSQRSFDSLSMRVKCFITF